MTAEEVQIVEPTPVEAGNEKPVAYGGSEEPEKAQVNGTTEAEAAPVTWVLHT